MGDFIKFHSKKDSVEHQLLKTLETSFLAANNSAERVACLDSYLKSKKKIILGYP